MKMKSLKNRIEFVPAVILFGVALVCVVIGMSGCGVSTSGIIVLTGTPPPGATGATGPAGQNGASIVEEAVSAPSGSCGTNPDGSNVTGSVVVMAQDDGSGSWNANENDQTSILLCNGSTGQTGATGATGSQGATGATGQNGSNGTNATLVTVVQFCENTTVYPSTFSEVGVCLGGQLYAVYSLNDGFLSLIPPGAYSSDGVNSSCTFTVGTNCTISQ
jgi:hypothetical protein